MDRSKKQIVHVDMDAFFASIEQRDEPSFRAKPVVVGSDPENGKGRGVVAAASYEARGYGIHSAMPISQAYHRCPHGIFIRPDMEKYSRESDRIFSVLLDFTPQVEPISIDEAFADITGSWHFWQSPENTCREIKKAIKETTGLTASLGLAPVKMAAKIASDLKKPDGFVTVPHNELKSFLSGLPAQKLWGVGEVTMSTLKKRGISTIGDIAGHDPSELEHLLGKRGIVLWNLANGLDDREVSFSDEVKSIGHEHTFREDTKEFDRIMDVLMTLSEDISRRMRRRGLTARTITLKVRSSSFKTVTRSETLKDPICHVEDIYSVAVRKLKTSGLDKEKIRLLGIRAENLLPAASAQDLFHLAATEDRKRESLQKAIDSLVDKYGKDAIRRRSP